MLAKIKSRQLLTEYSLVKTLARVPYCSPNRPATVCNAATCRRAAAARHRRGAIGGRLGPRRPPPRHLRSAASGRRYATSCRPAATHWWSGPGVLRVARGPVLVRCSVGAGRRDGRFRRCSMPTRACRLDAGSCPVLTGPGPSDRCFSVTTVTVMGLPGDTGTARLKRQKGIAMEFASRTTLPVACQ